MSFDNDIIITAMDRFVWFVLLVVMTHLVTEFTRVTGYARGPRHELILINDTLLQPMPVQNMLLYPSQEYAHYAQQQQRPAGNSLQQNAAMMLSSLTGSAGSSSNNNHNAAAATENSYPFFSLRPLIDSIFEIPISTLRAVNNLVGRLTGSYRQASEAPQKIINLDSSSALRSAPNTAAAASSNFKLSTSPQHAPIREELA
ncbi:CG9815 [Drosophila busckii]|uniref:CG9815 n=1 Tax=Drosophila busckii TaxID=30019 RepID=A0A0M4EV56_DROBS|nr:CG9815 [Drosophila busckii]